MSWSLGWSAEGEMKGRLRKPQSLSIPSAFGSSKRWVIGASQVESGKLILLRKVLVPAAAAAAKSLQSCPTLCDPIDSSPPGSPVPGILQARTLKWVAISFSNA